MRRFVPLILTLAAEAAAVVTLHRLWSPPSDAIGRVLWVAAVAGSWWLLMSTVLAVVAQRTRRATTLRASTRLTLPAIRRFTERTLAASVVAGGLLITPTVASAEEVPIPDPTVAVTVEPAEPAPKPFVEPAVEVAVRTGRVGDPSARVAATTELPGPEPAAPEPAAPDPAEPDSAEPVDRPGESARATGADTDTRENTPDPAVDAAPSPSAGDAAPTPSTTPGGPLPSPAGAAPPPTHVVTTGDNLWAIAAAHLATTSGRDVGTLGEDEVATYWRRVCDANRGRLRSGDVNLIFAGEVVELPPL